MIMKCNIISFPLLLNVINIFLIFKYAGLQVVSGRNHVITLFKTVVFIKINRIWFHLHNDPLDFKSIILLMTGLIYVSNFKCRPQWFNQAFNFKITPKNYVSLGAFKNIY